MEKHSDQSSPFKVSTEEKNEPNAGRLHVYNSVPHYSEQEAKALAERLVNKETFREAHKVLIAWLERGECKERNSAHFYFLIQLCLNHFEKLLTEQNEHLEDVVKTRESDILNKIEEVFNVIEKRNILGNFTQSQMKNMQEMRANIFDLKQNILTDASVNFEHAKIKEDPKILLQTKVGSLTYELNTANQVKEELKTKCKENENEILKLKSEFEKSREIREKNKVKKEMHLISLLSAFLYNHPKGVNIGGITSNLNSSPIIPATDAGEIENIMRKHPEIFKESLPIGATQETKWTCVSLTQETLTELLKNQ